MSEEMPLVTDVFERIQRLKESEAEDFATLIALLGMSAQTDFVEADLAGLSLVKQTFDGCNFTGADFSASDFNGSALKNCRLDNANLAGARIEYALVEGCCFREANLADAVFQGAILQGCDFTGANLTNAFFPKSSLAECDFTGATMTGVRFRSAALTMVNFHNAILAEDAFEDCALENTPSQPEETPDPSEHATQRRIIQLIRLAGTGEYEPQKTLRFCLSQIDERTAAFDDPIMAWCQVARTAYRFGYEDISDAAIASAVKFLGETLLPAQISDWLQLIKCLQAINQAPKAIEILDRVFEMAGDDGSGLPSRRILDTLEAAVKLNVASELPHRLLNFLRDTLVLGRFSQARLRLITRTIIICIAFNDYEGASVLEHWCLNRLHNRRTWSDRNWLSALYQFAAVQRKLDPEASKHLSMVRLIENIIESLDLPSSEVMAARVRLAAEFVRCRDGETASQLLRREEKNLKIWANNNRQKQKLLSDILYSISLRAATLEKLAKFISRSIPKASIDA